MKASGTMRPSLPGIKIAVHKRTGPVPKANPIGNFKDLNMKTDKPKMSEEEKKVYREMRTAILQTTIVDMLLFMDCTGSMSSWINEG